MCLSHLHALVKTQAFKDNLVEPLLSGTLNAFFFQVDILSNYVKITQHEQHNFSLQSNTFFILRVNFMKRLSVAYIEKVRFHSSSFIKLI